MNFHSSGEGCAHCFVRYRCITNGLSSGELKQFEHLMGDSFRIKRGRHLFFQGNVFESLYAVKFGVFKTTIGESEGREQVTGFRMFGEMIGFDGIAQKRHACNAIALEDSEVCVIPYPRMLLLTGELNPLKHRFFEFMSDEIVRCHGLITLLGSMNANQRLAAFLLNLLERQSAQGLSTTELILRMTRQEIASFLGLKLETVSRTLSKFSGMGLIKVNRRQIQAINSMQLQKIVT